MDKRMKTEEKNTKKENETWRRRKENREIERRKITNENKRRTEKGKSKSTSSDIENGNCEELGRGSNGQTDRHVNR